MKKENIDSLIELFFAKLREEKTLEDRRKFNKTNVSDKFYIIAHLLPESKNRISLRDIVNISSKNEPINEIEQLIINLNDSIDFVFKRKKQIYRNSAEMLFRILTNSDSQDKIFRNTNELPILRNEKAHVYDFNRVPKELENLLLFINEINEKNEKNSFIRMQIVLLRSLKIAPFFKYNSLFSKLLSIWFHNTQKNEKISPELYLSTLDIFSNELERAANEAIEREDSSYFLVPLLERLLQVTSSKIVVSRICEELKEKRNIYLSQSQDRFLLTIINFNLVSFVWKEIQRLVPWPMSKQFIIQTLSNLERFDLLDSQRVKNRKLYRRSRALSGMINRFSQTLRLENNNL